MINNEPMLPCPPWCNVKHEGVSTSHQLHRYTGDGDDGSVMVTLFMKDCGTKYAAIADRNGEVDLHVSIRRAPMDFPCVIRPVAEASELVAMAFVFGRDDVAARIAELAELAGQLVTISLPVASSANEVPGLSRG
jgi:hypothetical protein